MQRDNSLWRKGFLTSSLSDKEIHLILRDEATSVFIEVSEKFIELLIIDLRGLAESGEQITDELAALSFTQCASVISVILSPDLSPDLLRSGRSRVLLGGQFFIWLLVFDCRRIFEEFLNCLFQDRGLWLRRQGLLTTSHSYEKVHFCLREESAMVLIHS